MSFSTLAPRPGHRRIAVTPSSIATTVNFMFAKPTSNKIHGIVSNLKYVQLLMYFRSYMGIFSLVQIPPVHHKFITISLVPKKKKPRPQSSGSIRAMIKKEGEIAPSSRGSVRHFLVNLPCFNALTTLTMYLEKAWLRRSSRLRGMNIFHGRGIP